MTPVLMCSPFYFFALILAFTQYSEVRPYIIDILYLFTELGIIVIAAIRIHAINDNTLIMPSIILSLYAPLVTIAIVSEFRS